MNERQKHRLFKIRRAIDSERYYPTGRGISVTMAGEALAIIDRLEAEKEAVRAEKEQGYPTKDDVGFLKETLDLIRHLKKENAELKERSEG